MLLAEFKKSFPHVDKFKNRDEVRLKFIAGGMSFNSEDDFDQTMGQTEQFYINPVPYMLRTWYNHNSENSKRLKWTPTILSSNFQSIEEIIEELRRDEVDVVCMGMYVWSTYAMLEIGRTIRENFPDMVIIGGGPDAYAHREPTKFLSQWHFFDAIVYGDGEQAFADLMDCMINSGSVKNDIFNLVFRDQDHNSKVTEHSRLKSKKFEDISWVNESRKIMINEVKHVRERYGYGMHIAFVWEYARGCPYKCSFCDWNSGLHHKVSRRKNVSYREELKFIANLSKKYGDIEIYWSDANIGIFEEDVEIWKYAADLEATYKNFHGFYSPAMAKLNKQRVMDMWDYRLKRIRSKGPSDRLIKQVALQDIDEEVLKHIDRPDIPWPEHKEMLLKLSKENPNLWFGIQIITGLPGQNINKMSNMLCEFVDLERVSKVSQFQWSLLPNSPADSPEYQEKFGIKSAGFRRYYFKDAGKTRQEVAEKGKYNLERIVMETYSYDLAEYLGMLLLVYTFNALTSAMAPGNQKLKNKFKMLLQDTEFYRQQGKKYAKMFEDDMAKYGEYIWLIEDEISGEIVDFSYPFRKFQLNSFQKELADRHTQKVYGI